MDCLFVGSMVVTDMPALCDASSSVEANTEWQVTGAAGLEPGCEEIRVIPCKARTSHCRVSRSFPSRYCHGLSCPAFLTSHTCSAQAGKRREGASPRPTYRPLAVTGGWVSVNPGCTSQMGSRNTQDCWWPSNRFTAQVCAWPSQLLRLLSREPQCAMHESRSHLMPRHKWKLPEHLPRKLGGPSSRLPPGPKTPRALQCYAPPS